MAVTHPTTVRNAIADTVCARVNTGGAGTLECQTSGGVEVATLTFSATAFQSASSGSATAYTISPDASATGGTLANGVVKSGSGAEVFRFTFGTGGGGDLSVSSLSVNPGDQVALSNFAYTACP